MPPTRLIPPVPHGHTDRYIELPADHVFVFGSNLLGRHGAGAAADAATYFGAREGAGAGWAGGRAYAIPTKDEHLRVRSLPDIYAACHHLVRLARATPSLVFVVTEIGCGFAGYQPSDIAPAFIDATPNVRLPRRFVDLLNLMKEGRA